MPKTKPAPIEIKPFSYNPRTISDQQIAQLDTDMNELGDIGLIVHDWNSGQVIDGNQRSTLLDLFDRTIDDLIKSGDLVLTKQFDKPDKQGTVAIGFIHHPQKGWFGYRGVRWNKKQIDKANIKGNLHAGEFDGAALKEYFNRSDLLSFGMDSKSLDELGFTLDRDTDGGGGSESVAEVDRAEELQEKWQVKEGDIYSVGDHRIICGDSTDPNVIKELMKKDKAVLIHGDPPYGMGKEKEGIENDNLYGKKLDEFQMKWWGACRPFLEDNGSAYIWGNAEDLWRLWYLGGLKDSERLTFRNEIVWDKQDDSNPTLRVNGKTFESMRSHYQSERCLFFMLGEQGFNNNSDNYWTGWDSIRLYLLGEAEKMKWTPKDIERICGVGMFGHWFTTSQWTFIPEEHYLKLQKAANGKAFNRPYKETDKEAKNLKKEFIGLKEEFYASRAFFDNSFENMTDVWNFSRVIGEDRQGHATPKPVAMMERIIKISTPPEAVILVPFGGTAPELPAAQTLGRVCRVVETKPEYIAVELERMQTAFPKIKIKKL